MKLTVGLGNPGEKYATTRHNAGFLILDEFAKARGLNWQEDKKFKCLRAECDGLLIIKPQTFMNNSGESVSAIANFYKIPFSEIVIIHDEVDLDFGKTKMQIGSRSAGHRGVESIIEQLGTNEFWRFRFGVGKDPERQIPTDEWVLMNFTSVELDFIKNFKPEFLYK